MPRAFLPGGVDRGNRELATEALGTDLGQCGGQRGLAVVDVTDGADVDVRLGALEHPLPLFYTLIVRKWFQRG